MENNFWRLSDKASRGKRTKKIVPTAAGNLKMLRSLDTAELGTFDMHQLFIIDTALILPRVLGPGSLTRNASSLQQLSYF